MKHPVVFVSVLFFVTTSFSQDSLDVLADLAPTKQPVYSAFKSPRIIMAHSIEMVKEGALDFRILHRFGPVNQGISEFFGLDDASIRLGLDYGLLPNLTIGIGRSSYKKELDGFVKFRAVQQTSGEGNFPFSIVVVGGSVVNTAEWTGAAKQENFVNRLSHYGQLLLGRKFSQRLTLQPTPTFLHRNLVAAEDPNNSFALGTGGRISLTRRVSLTFDHFLVVHKSKQTTTYNPFSIGFDIETGGHVFQLHFTNAVGMNERAFLMETTNRWSNGDIQFGFNISRTFQLKSKKLK